MATKTKLIFTPPSETPSKYSLDRTGTYIVGTSESCDITIDDDQLAEKHGKLVADETNEGRWFLQEIETGAIAVLEDGSIQTIGMTKIDVSIKQVAAPAKIDDEDEEEDDEYDDEEYEDDDGEYEEDDEGEDEDDSFPNFDTDSTPDNQRQLEDLKKAHQLREIKSAVILVIVCAILSFAAGVAFRLMK